MIIILFYMYRNSTCAVPVHVYYLVYGTLYDMMYV